MERKGLGRGLSALIPQKQEVTEQDKIVFLRVEQIRPNPFQPREEINPQSLEELVQSIKEKGIIQPIVVRQKGEQYELIAGERRLRATKLLNLNEIPALIKDASDEECLELALIENIQRQNLNPIEQAKAYQYLINKFGITQERVGQIVGKARVSITNMLRLLKLPHEVQQEIKAGKLTFAHARALLELEEPSEQKELSREIIANSLSVNELENIIRRKKEKRLKRTKSAQDSKNPYLSAMEGRLQQSLGTKVSIFLGRKRGHIQIEFYSQDDLDRICNTIVQE
ncbi:MAG: ParB/RepB/Spo0J family partition protein [Candidatus Omnitrophota bacterium]